MRIDRPLPGPDGFGFDFDQVWQAYDREHPGHGLSAELQKRAVLELLAEHPWLRENGHQASRLADFRIRLLLRRGAITE